VSGISIELRLLNGGATHVTTPSGRRFSVATGPGELWEQLGRQRDGGDVAAELTGAMSVLAEAGVFPRPRDLLIAVVAGPTAGPGAARALCGRLASQQQVTCELADLPAVVSRQDYRDHGVVVVVHGRYDWRAMLRDELVLRQHAIPYLFFHQGATSACFGPLIRRGDPVSYRDLHERRLCAARDLNELRLEMEAPLFGTLADDGSECGWSLQTLATWLTRELRASAPEAWAEYEVRARELTVRRHLLLPMPDRADGRRLPQVSGLADLVDARTGIVTRLEAVRFHTAAAEGLHCAQAWTADLRRVYGRDASAVNAGFSFTSAAEAEAIAVAESVERYCGNIVDARELTSGSWTELERAGRHPVDPERLALFSLAQYRAAGFPFAPFSRSDEGDWVTGQSLTRARAVLIPASLAYLNWYLKAGETRVRHHPVNFAGISAGSSREQALANALEELVERDAMMAWWLAGARLPEVPAPGLVADRVARAERAGFRCWFLQIPHPTGIPVIAAVLDNPGDEMTTAGFACRNTQDLAAAKAWTEAVALHETCLDLQRPDGLVWGARGRSRLGDLGLRPHRADRAYRRDYRADFADVTSLFAQVQANLDPTVRRRSLAVLEPAGTARPAAAMDRSADDYRQRIEVAGGEVLVADLTTSDVRSAGLVVVRALVPGYLPNFPTAYPPLGGLERIRRHCAAAGWPAPDDDKDINALPLPYA
jgi:ribosomal protein S12 methylthiotransferase accessory factor